jgi:hypothetical protein
MITNAAATAAITLPAVSHLIRIPLMPRNLSAEAAPVRPRYSRSPPGQVSGVNHLWHATTTSY